MYIHYSGSATLMYLTNARVGQAVDVFKSTFDQSVERITAFTNDTSAVSRFSGLSCLAWEYLFVVMQKGTRPYSLLVTSGLGRIYTIFLFS